MHFTTFAAVASLVVAAQAHFQLAFPPPRGEFVEDKEPDFCGGYPNAVNNRTIFPLSGGFFTINAEHPQWSLGVEISTAKNPNSFDNFTSNGQAQYARQFAQTNGEGEFCIPLPLNNTGIDGVKDGANVTIQIVFSGGDGNLYQCADLTLSSNATIPSSISCSNATSASSSNSSGGSSGSSSGGSTGNSAAVLGSTVSSPLMIVPLALAGAMAAFA